MQKTGAFMNSWFVISALKHSLASLSSILSPPPLPAPTFGAPGGHRPRLTHLWSPKLQCLEHRCGHRAVCKPWRPRLRGLPLPHLHPCLPYHRAVVPSCLALGTSSMEDNFSMNKGWGVGGRRGAGEGEEEGGMVLGWFKYIISIVNLFLLLLHQLHLRSSGIRSQRSGTFAIEGQIPSLIFLPLKFPSPFPLLLVYV